MPERIALTHSTSGGINLVLGGLAFGPGDEIVTTDNEHPGLLEPLAALARRYGVVVRVAEALHGTDPLDAIAAHIGPRTKVVALSHVLWANGRILPLREIAEAAHAAGTPLVVDGAQGVGAIEVDPAALGVDVYPRPGQKWLCGPNGVGFLWLADGFEERLRGGRAELLHARFPQRGAALLARRAPARRRLAGDRGARRPGRRRGVPAPARGLERGRGRRWRASALRCVALLSEVPGVTLQAESEGAAPLVAFTVAGKDGGGGRRERSRRPRESSRARCPASTGCASRSATGSRTAISSAWRPRRAAHA